ncbi:bifunctional diaminohydroxyphosphoribosylaminopyrimidine deaminase/5-amino-6-(5-phosphoribosylamino)uracil reductase RibD [Kangiella sp. HZ709]|uniref:bifunctional diaminohydroxyphosphoribosylaminopyrimidine deaminase/5-amino-6-(5-phosphoribosylamino)uracil reductase RibD n=1 Tax=Kangiella sp. HZ709 TaxID=2666328 RepID=UPI0012B115FF|nr:bifunctional diaminohydroxyphosphoribosylaminopyrimidine deaminase/5-amino-6-(5-phosphoribosylamino)uracil reductase RibD [Kangiella sp. HZ709]MRX28681.1 bifunctional diaminohydroxyphosphoribosylaminopyrimidine deaminase/5-amino-6-(5-phosphoribosylamino)uracil reductase RibD [Kangiella sp. HZ709]
MNFSKQDSIYMARAIELAKKGWFTTRANPRVGCVIVKNDQIISEGWHEKAGLDHAEINAINNASQDLTGATVYVTLEPCSHFGKKPPCALALAKAGIVKVICAMQDPNPLVAGKGIAQLIEAGIQVETGLMELEATQLNSGFINRMTLGLPRVVIKSAISLDGKIAMASGESQWITGEQARADVQQLRAESCAIITGTGTVINDNPSLNVRDTKFLNKSYFEQPLRVVIDSQGLLDADAKIFQQQGEVWLVTGNWQNKNYPANVNQEIVDTNEFGNVDLYQLLLQLADRGINQVLVEAGSGLAAAFLERGLADELVVYMAPKILGSSAMSAYQLPFDKMSQSIGVDLKDVRHFGDDLKLSYSVKK